MTDLHFLEGIKNEAIQYLNFIIEIYYIQFVI